LSFLLDVDRLAAGRRRRRVAPQRPAGSVHRRPLAIDVLTADARGRLIARRVRVGRPMGVMDGWIAATAVVHGLTLVARDVAAFTGTVGEIICPWTAG